MSMLVARPEPTPPIPLPSVPVTVRAATAEDLPFIDALQKKHAKQVGWMPRQQLEGKIAAGQVLIAVGATPASPEFEGAGVGTGDAGVAPTGYVIASDQYFKRDDVGIIYQMNVVPGHSGRSSGRRC